MKKQNKRLKWKDQTTYSQGQKSREPGSLMLGLPHDIRVVLHRLVCVPNAWFVTLRHGSQVIICDHELEAKNLEKAKEEAVDLASRELKGLSDKVLMAAYRLQEGAE